MRIDTSLGGLYVDAHGEGEPVVLWHSLLCDGGMWRLVEPALAERYRVISIDGPGHGRSAPIHAPFTLEDCADAAVEVLDALEVDRAHWVGLSWGGMTGMRLALAHPERVRSLSLLDTSAAPEVLRKVPSYLVMTAIARRFGAIGFLIDRIERIMFHPQTLASARAEVVTPFREHLAAMDPASTGHCVDAVILKRGELRDQLWRIDSPTLVVVGDRDIATPLPRAREIAEKIPGARLEIVAGAGHLSALEQPARIAELLLDHLASAPA